MRAPRRAPPAVALAVALTALAASACASYRADSFSHQGRWFSGERRIVGCLDVAVEVVEDPQALGPAVGYTFGNRCAAAVAVAFDAVRAVGRYPDGDRIPLPPYDPDREIRPALLEARRAGREVIEYLPPAGRGAPEILCLDLAGLDPGARKPGPIEVCVGLARGPAALSAAPDPGGGPAPAHPEELR